MRLVVVTSIRLFGDGLSACLSEHPEICLRLVVSDLKSLRQSLACEEMDAALIDVTQGVNLDDVRATALAHPSVALVALGLEEQKQTVIRCGRAGFRGYIDRNASVDHLCSALKDACDGRLNCSAELSSELLRALFFRSGDDGRGEMTDSLTIREGEVLQLIGDGLSNKEIATELCVSVATVKHHVHHVLNKLKLPRRAQAMRRVREEPWIATSPWERDRASGHRR
jgi:two-component system, NarL family, nitrate/nitrite response regulator NarL